MDARGSVLTLLLGGAVLGSAALGVVAVNAKRTSAELKEQVTALSEHDEALQERVTRLAHLERRRAAARAVAARNVRNLRDNFVRFRLRSERLEAAARGLEAETGQREEARDRAFTGQAERLARVERELKALEAERARARSGEAESERRARAASATVDSLRREIERYRSRDESYAAVTREYQTVVRDARRALTALSAAEARSSALRRETARAHYNMGVLYAREGRHADAARELEIALSLEPSDPLAHYNLALIQDAWLGDPAAAAGHYREYLRLLPSAEDAKKVEYRLFQLRLEDEVDSPVSRRKTR